MPDRIITQVTGPISFDRTNIVPSLGIGATAKVVAYDTETKQVEGEHAGHQTVVLEYPTMEEAVTAYESEAYQAVLPLRFAATSKHFGLLVKGA